MPDAASCIGHARRLIALSAGLVLSANTCLFAQSGENVAVVINDASPVSREIGAHYVRKRAVPASNVIHLETNAGETIDRSDYVRDIETPIARALTERSLQDRILYVVLTKGVPLRIDGTGGHDGSAASVDSELTLLYRRMSGVPAAILGKLPNPYYLGERDTAEAASFSHRGHDIYLVTRIDAFTTEEAIALIDRAQAPSSEGVFVLDQRGGMHSDKAGDTWLAEAARRLQRFGSQYPGILESTTAASGSQDNVLGYYSWGSNDPANRVRRFGMRFVPGAIGATFVSSDARTFTPPPPEWQPSGTTNDFRKLFAGSSQTLAGDLIREGITGVAGHVGEPYLASTIRPQILFPAYVGGRNLAEAFYLAMPHLSWQTVVIGDPLCSPGARSMLTRPDLEEPIDPALNLPGLFARRRIENLRRAFKDLPDASLSLMIRIESQMLVDDKAAARKGLEELTGRHPALWRAQLQLAALYEAAREHRQAIARYREVLKVQPDSVVALNNLAFALAVQEHAPADALPHARRAAALAPTDPSVMDTLGWVQYLGGDKREAVRMLEQASRLAPRSPDVRLHLAIALADIGELDAAARHLAEAIRLDRSFDSRPEVQTLQRRLRGK